MSVRTPSYRLHKPAGRAVVTIDGRDYYLGPHGSPESHSEYDRLVGEWLAAGRRRARAGAAGDPGDLTVNELLLGYLRWADGYYRKPGPHDHRTGQHPAGAAPAAPALRPHDRPGVRPAGPEGRPAGHDRRRSVPRRGQQTRRHVVRAFKWAVENELVPPSVRHGLKAVSGLRRGRSEARESEPVKPVPDAFVDALEPVLAPRPGRWSSSSA